MMPLNAYAVMGKMKLSQTTLTHASLAHAMRRQPLLAANKLTGFTKRFFTISNLVLIVQKIYLFDMFEALVEFLDPLYSDF